MIYRPPNEILFFTAILLIVTYFVVNVYNADQLTAKTDVRAGHWECNGKDGFVLKGNSKETDIMPMLEESTTLTSCTKLSMAIKVRPIDSAYWCFCKQIWVKK